MSIERREQVFISSTYLDLKDERQAVIQILLEADCFPAGMELFPASDDEKWDLITNVIDDSDYYVVIVGGRYGSTGEDGLSFTEKEFDYAVSAKKPVMGFLHGNPGSVSVDKSDIDPAAREKLAAFRSKVEERMVKYWTSPEDLSGALAVSLIKTRKSHPAVGWVRGDNVLSPEVETEIAQLREKVATLTQQLESREGRSSDIDILQLAQGDDEYSLPIVVRYWEKDQPKTMSNALLHVAAPRTTWDRVFAQLAPLMLDEATEGSIQDELNHLGSELLVGQVDELDFPEDADTYSKDVETERKVIRDVLVQLFSLGLIKKSEKRHQVHDSATYWTLTEQGRGHMTRLRAIRREPGAGDVVEPSHDAEADG